MRRTNHRNLVNVGILSGRIPLIMPCADESELVVFSVVWSSSNRSAALGNLLGLAEDMGRQVCTDYCSILPQLART